MKQKRQLIDHWVASRSPFLRFLFHFRDKSFFMTTGATLVRYEQPSEGSASPPLADILVTLLRSTDKNTKPVLKYISNKGKKNMKENVVAEDLKLGAKSTPNCNSSQGEVISS